MKWFPKLSKEEFLAWWKTQDHNIDNKIKIQSFDNYAMVYIWEFGWLDSNESIATKYKITDFKIEPLETYEFDNSENERNAGYVAFMAKKFGKLYIADLLCWHTSIPTEQWLTILQDNKE